MSRRFYLALAIFATTWVLLVATAPGIPIVWDEGEYIHRASMIRVWFRLGLPAFAEEAIRSHWFFINHAEGHPAWFAIPIALGQRFAGGSVDALMAARLGPITVFSAACAAVAIRLRNSYGTAAAVAAPLALLTFPRIFSEAHFATQDGQLTAWWLMLWALDSSILTQGRAAALGVLLGLTSATKFTGWFAWMPVAGWRLILAERSALRRLLVIVPVALVVFYAVNAPLWHHPFAGFASHVHRSLDRANTLNVATFFLGERYDLKHPLPWYNTLVWLAIVTPVPTLALGLLGLWRSLADRTRASVLLLLHWITMMVVRALPGAPPHDGIRLFLPAFGFWCVFAAIGVQVLWNISKRCSPASRVLIRSALIAAFLSSAVTVARYYPQTLSHYNLIIGGVEGAARRGFEPAYWWDGLDKDVLGWLNERTEPGAAIAFSQVANTALLRDWGRLRPRDVDPAKETFKWYVLQNRPGFFTDRDRALLARETPVFVKYAGRRSANATVPADLHVPLIAVFSYDQYQRAGQE